MVRIDAYWQKGFAEADGWLSRLLIHPLKANGQKHSSCEVVIDHCCLYGDESRCINNACKS